MTTHLLAIVMLMAVLALWVMVQRAWRRAFPEACADPDVLAGRGSCHGCTSTDECERRRKCHG